MDKNEKQIMVVPRDVLFSGKQFEGFQNHGEINYESVILENHLYLKRGLAEEDPGHKQPIAYCMIVNPELKKVFAFQRSSKDKHYHEKRLHGKWSWGVGGHIEKIDGDNPIHTSMLRELSEEIEMNGSMNPKVIGYINDESDPVSQVHFGVLYLIETDSTIIKPRDQEMAEGELRSMEELEKITSTEVVEEWSKIALGPLKQYFDNL